MKKIINGLMSNLRKYLVLYAIQNFELKHKS